MNTAFDSSEVISAFLDHEPFDAGQLATALADPAGRALLIDLIALRSLTQVETDAGVHHVTLPRKRRWNWIAASVVLAAALGAGFGAGRWSSASTPAATTTAAADAAPPPTRVISDIEWRTTPGGN